MSDKGELFLSLLKDPEVTEDLECIDKMSPDALNEYQKLLQKLKGLHTQNHPDFTSQQLTRLKGIALENLARHLLENSGYLFKVGANFHTTTNEIDAYVELTAKASALSSLLDFKGDRFLCECKNYQKKVGVAMVGKFAHLVMMSNIRLGIFFSYCGMCGRHPWHSSLGLVRKVNMSKERACEKIYIIDFSLSDFELIAQGNTFYQILKGKCHALDTDVKFEDLLAMHPAETNNEYKLNLGH